MGRSRHGMLGDKFPSEYNAWRNMKRKCLDPMCKSYPYYGARGIEICPEWVRSFPRFLGDIGPKPSPGLWLCRIDLEKGYWPENCRWMPAAQQISRRRNSLQIVLSGVPMTVREAAALVGISRVTLLERLRQHRLGATPSSKPTA